LSDADASSMEKTIAMLKSENWRLSERALLAEKRADDCSTDVILTSSTSCDLGDAWIELKRKLKGLGDPKVNAILSVPVIEQIKAVGEARSVIYENMVYDLKQMHKLGTEIGNQDCRATPHPIYVVQECVRSYGIDPEFSDKSEWVDWEGAEGVADEEKAKELDGLDSRGLSTGDWVESWYIDKWEYVAPFFTKVGADCYIERNKYEHRGPLRVYVASGYRNPEWRMIRNSLLKMAGKETE